MGVLCCRGDVAGTSYSAASLEIQADDAALAVTAAVSSVGGANAAMTPDQLRSLGL